MTRHRIAVLERQLAAQQARIDALELALAAWLPAVPDEDRLGDVMQTVIRELFPASGRS